MIPEKEIQKHVAYLSGLCNEEEKLELVDIKPDLFTARRAWDTSFYMEESGLREEKFIDNGGKEWFLLLKHHHD